MNLLTMAIGMAAFLFGAYTMFLRMKDPAKLGKLAVMKERMGDTVGTVVHTVAYSIVPIAAGIIFCLAGMTGTALF